MFIITVSPIGAQELSDYLIGYNGNGDSLAGMTVLSIESDNAGVMIRLEEGGIPVSLGLLDAVNTAAVESSLNRFREEILAEQVRMSEGREIRIQAADISVGVGGELFVECSLSLYELQLEERVFLDFAKRIDRPLSLRYRDDQPNTPYRLPLREIRISESSGPDFPGWDALSEELLAWARNGLERNDQEVMGTILEIRRLSEEELEEEKEIVIAAEPDEVHWANLGLSIEVSIPELVASSADGVLAGIPSLMLQPLAYFEFFELGGDERFQPYDLRFALGPFADYRLIREDDTFLHQTLGWGVAFNGSFSTYIPRLEGYRLEGRAYGLGAELQLKYNLGAQLGRLDSSARREPLSTADYLFDITPAGVIHFLPAKLPAWDLIIGFPLKYMPDYFVEDAIELEEQEETSWYSFGISIGIRTRFPLLNLYRSTEGT